MPSASSGSPASPTKTLSTEQALDRCLIAHIELFEMTSLLHLLSVKVAIPKAGAL